MTFDRWLAIIGIAASGVLSWLISRHYYRRSDKRRVPTFVLNPRRKVLADATLANLKDFSIRHKHQDIGKSGITQVDVYFWNSGELPITQADVLESFMICVSAKILRCSVLKASRNVTGISAEVLWSETEAEVKFSLLEPGDGATVQLIYDGPADATISFVGACVGAAKPTVLPPDPMYFKPVSKRLFEASQPLLFAIISSVTLLAVLGSVGWLIKRFFGEHIFSIVLLSGVGILFLMVLTTLAWEHYKKITAKYVPPEIR